jgi:uncharacterized protein (UPF0276 family)
MSISIGIAYADYVPRLLDEHPGAVDFVEIPFELLQRSPETLEIQSKVAVVMHCASLSLAGDVPIDPAHAQQLQQWVVASGTPWLGEHIAFIRADSGQLPLAGEMVRPSGDALDIGYTVSPQWSEPVLARILANVHHWEQFLDVPILLENGPVYFTMPGSTMSQTEFIIELCRRRPATRLLLDLSHLSITCANMNLDCATELNKLPVENVVEIHLSGMHYEAGICWDDHGRRIPQSVFDLLESALLRCTPRAITIEYNWNADMPIAAIAADLDRVRHTSSLALA